MIKGSPVSLQFYRFVTGFKKPFRSNVPGPNTNLGRDVAGKKEGTIEVGKKANLLFLNSNPAENINHIDDLFMVIKNGKFYNKK